MNLKGVICCAMLFVLTAPAWAQEDARPLEAFLYFLEPELVMQNQRTLKLTAEQKDTIKAAIQTAQTAFTDAQWQLLDEMETMKELVKPDRTDEEQVLAQLEKILDLERQIKRAQISLLMRIKNTLTPEQLDRLQRAGTADTNKFSDIF